MPFSYCVTSCNCHVLQCRLLLFSVDLGGMEGDISVASVYGFDMTQYTMCSAGHNTHKIQPVLSVLLEYPPKFELTPDGRRKTDKSRPSFASLLQASLCHHTRTKAWCSSCSDYRQLSQRKVRLSADLFDRH